jgi:hypothetical protein
MYPTKTIWRIRLTLPDDLHSRAVLHQALADQAVCALRLLPRDSGRAEMTGELMIEAAEGEVLGTLLGSLHIVSPEVFVTRADLSPSPAATPGASFSARTAAGRPVSA